MGELSDVLTWWRETRDPDLAWLVEAFSRLHGERFTISRGGWSSLHDAWMYRASDATDEELPALLPDVPRGRAAIASTKLEFLMSRGPDPRVFQAALEWTRALMFRTEPANQVWWKQIETILSHWGPHDFDFVGLAREVTKRHRSAFAKRIAKRIAALRSLAPVPTPLPAELRAQVDAWLALHPPPQVEGPLKAGVTTEELLHAIFADPDDDEPRAVLADLLVEAGDPRGPFIQRQLASDDVEIPIDLREAFALWFGEDFLGHASPKFRRGFPETVELRSHLRKLVGAPGFQTVRRLAVLRRPRTLDVLSALFAHPVCEHIRQVQLPHEVLPALVGGPAVVSVDIGKFQDWHLEGIGATLEQLPTVTRVTLGRAPTMTDRLSYLRVREIRIEGVELVSKVLVKGILQGLAPEVAQIDIEQKWPWSPLGESVSFQRTSEGWERLPFREEASDG
ncbi:MAG: TIGR02996 domain-containing protein [Myxococcota bacterium]